MNIESIIAFIQSHILEIVLMLALIFVLRNWQLILISCLIVAGLSYFGLLNIENIKEFIITQIDNLNISEIITDLV